MNADIEPPSEVQPAKRATRYEIRWWGLAATAGAVAALVAVGRFSTFAAEAIALAALAIPAVFFVWRGFRNKHEDLPPVDTPDLYVLPHSDGGGGGDCAG